MIVLTVLLLLRFVEIVQRVIVTSRNQQTNDVKLRDVENSENPELQNVPEDILSNDLQRRLEDHKRTVTSSDREESTDSDIKNGYRLPREASDHEETTTRQHSSLSSRNSYSDLDNDTSMERSITIDQKRAMEHRLCLLIYEEGNDIFKADCEVMAKVLRRDQHELEGSSNVKVLPAEDFSRTALGAILEVESTIHEKLIKKVTKTDVTKDIDGIDLRLLMYYAYLSIRLKKAEDKFREGRYIHLLLPKNQHNLIDTLINNLVVIVYDRWSLWVDLIIFQQLTGAQQLRVLGFLMEMNEGSLKDLKTASSDKSCSSCDRLPEHVIIQLEKLMDKQKKDLDIFRNNFDVGQHVILNFANHLFSLSVYCTGFPVGKPVTSGSTCKIQRDYKVLYYKMLNEFVSNGNREERTWKFNKGITEFFSLFITDQFCTDWLWIHYSGHNKPSSIYKPCLPRESIEQVLDLCFEYFSNVVISLDCCYPKLSIDDSLQHITTFFACQSYCTTEFGVGEVASYFTKRLAAVLNGCDPMNCPLSKKVSRCTICQKIHDKIKRSGAIFPDNVSKFFDKHKLHPNINFHIQEPLVSAPSAKPSTLCDTH